MANGFAKYKMLDYEFLKQGWVLAAGETLAEAHFSTALGSYQLAAHGERH